MAGIFAKAARTLRRLPRWLYVVAALGFAIVFPLLESAGVIEMLWLRVGTRVLVYVLLAIGLNLVMGETGLLHLGYVAFFAVGAYTTAILSSRTVPVASPASTRRRSSAGSWTSPWSSTICCSSR
jgi:branched-chain amino acid transport system permease protein